MQDQILVERNGYAFFVGIQYERLQSFCSSYKIIGRSISNCKKAHQDPDKAAVESIATKKKFLHNVPNGKVNEIPANNDNKENINNGQKDDPKNLDNNGCVEVQPNNVPLNGVISIEDEVLRHPAVPCCFFRIKPH